jgi:hypothetical protein
MGLWTKKISGHFLGGIPERPKGSDCKSDAKASVVRIHLPPPFNVAYRLYYKLKGSEQAL